MSTHIYYDMSTVNNYSVENESKHLTFKDNRSMPAIDDVSNYYVSVIRFNLSTANSLPIWIPTIDTNNNLSQRSDKTIYSFTLKHKKRRVYDKILTSFTITPPVNNSVSIIYDGVGYNTSIPFGLYGTSLLLTTINTDPGIQLPLKLDRTNTEPNQLSTYTPVVLGESHVFWIDTAPEHYNIIEGVNNAIRIHFQNPYNNPALQDYAVDYTFPAGRYTVESLRAYIGEIYGSDQTINGVFAPHFPVDLSLNETTNRVHIDWNYSSANPFPPPSSRYMFVEYNQLLHDLGFEGNLGLMHVGATYTYVATKPNLIFGTDFIASALSFEQKGSSNYVSITANQSITLQPSELLFKLGADRLMENTQLNIGDVLTLPNLPTYEDFTFTSSDQCPIYFKPTNKYDSKPVYKDNLNSMDYDYYYVQSFQHIRDMFNDTLKTAFDNLKSKAVLSSTQPPYFEYDIDTSKFILNGDVNLYDALNENECVEIYCNTALFTLICSFPHDSYGQRNVSDGCNYKLRLHKEMNNTNVIEVNNTSILQIFQEYSCGGLFSPISSIVFTTSLLPIASSLTGCPQFLNGTSQELGSNIIPIVSDFQSENDNGLGYVGNIHYLPSNEYRLIDMIGRNSELNNIEIAVYWRDTFGILHPFKMKAGMQCNVKFMFRHVGFNG